MSRLPLLVLVLACCTGVLGMGRGESPPRQDGVTIVGQEQAKPKPESPLTLSIHTGKKEYRQLQPIAIEFDLHNTTADQHFLYFDSYPAPNDFTLIVWRKGPKSHAPPTIRTTTEKIRTGKVPCESFAPVGRSRVGSW